MRDHQAGILDKTLCGVAADRTGHQHEGKGERDDWKEGVWKARQFGSHCHYWSQKIEFSWAK